MFAICNTICNLCFLDCQVFCRFLPPTGTNLLLLHRRATFANLNSFAPWVFGTLFFRLDDYGVGSFHLISASTPFMSKFPKHSNTWYTVFSRKTYIIYICICTKTNCKQVGVDRTYVHTYLYIFFRTFFSYLLCVLFFKAFSILLYY